LGVARVLRVIINSFTFILLLLLSTVFWETNALIALLLLLASIDQLEDVYCYVYGKRLFPSWFMPFDLIFEFVALGIGFCMLVFGLIYYSYFETWLFRSMIFLSIPVMYSAIEDVVLWFKPIKTGLGVSLAPIQIHKKEEFRFIRKKR